jgi:nucleotide-binding universal stress UspA family protein
MDHIHTILVPTDFSDCSRYAFHLAGMLARQAGARMVVVHVKQTLGPMVAYGTMLEGMEPVQDEQKLRDVLEHFRLPDTGVAIEHRLVCGDAVAEILRMAREVGADLVVMGTHGWKGLTRLLMGSVAEKVLRESPCPVVTVKTQERAAPTRPSGQPLAASQR